jgi:hypothetical protein
MREHHFTLSFEDFTAELVLGGEWSLHDFAAFIIETVGFDFDHAFQFCDDLGNPYASAERYTLFADVKESTAKRPFRKVLSTRGSPPEQYPDYED